MERKCRDNVPALLTGVVCAVMACLAWPASAEPCGEWTQVEVPAGANGAVIEVTGTASDDAWAFAYGAGLVHWDGTVWSSVSVPDLSGSYEQAWYTELFSASPSDLFMAGTAPTSPFTVDQVLAIWDGTDWRIESLELAPDIAGVPRNASPYAVGGSSPDDVWIVGRAESMGDGVGGEILLTLHWDGSSLTEYITEGQGNRQNTFIDLAVISSDDIWAVGEFNTTGAGGGHFHGQIYHWDGSSWSHVPSPALTIPSSGLNSVTAIGPNDVWAAGSRGLDPLFLHWDGASWTEVPGPPVQGPIHQIAALASDNVWAVDTAVQVPIVGKYYHWDGTAWSVVTPPDVAGATQVARHGGMAAVGECDIWAVGSKVVGSDLGPFIERLQPGLPVSSVPELGAQASFVRVSPNPLRESAHIAFDVPAGTVTRANIFDSSGRVIRSLVEGAAFDGRMMTWDGRDDTGREVSEGVYFLRAQAEDGRLATEKLTVVR